MSKADDTRDRILDAFEQLVLEHGERAGTIAATADAAGVSKGGLLYHFGSKTALVEGLAERLDRFGVEEEDRLSPMPDAVQVFLRESLAAEHPIDRTLVALLKLGQHDEHQAAREALTRLDEHYLAALTASLGDRDLALLVVRLSDGIYLRSVIGGSGSLPADSVERVIARLELLLEG
ncbi:TetR/AcrR family transcriptional regulator [Agrococcus sp. Marseille-P2731]|uniref:TetR/AcrR family transcriptional regulator n=1 Tax=Agrococcus sp. Marseille-P2731 TaxID=1841862 RepID=UPI000931AA4F|nr:TetR/AcrR family transcriptional regulator [Agrococcus sp. Marseille-P2731]